MQNFLKLNPMPTKQKWFYPAQEKIKYFLQSKYGNNYRCEFQDVCKFVAYETYACWYEKEFGKPQESERIIFVIHKHHSRSTRGPAIIEVMYSKYEHTMQYFQPEKPKP